MGISQAPPFHSTPGAPETVKRFIPARHFAGVTEGTWEPTAVGQTIEWIGRFDDLNVDGEVKISVVWSTDTGSTSDTVTFIPTFSAITLESDTLTAAQSHTAISAAIGADTASGTANTVQETPQGTINGGTLTDGDLFLINLEIDAVVSMTLGTDAMHIYGIFVEYVQKSLAGA